MSKESRYCIVGNVPEWMRSSYSLLYGTHFCELFPKETIHSFGTIIEIYTMEDEFQKNALMCDMCEKRYFSFCMEGTTVMDIKTIANFTNNPAPSAYIGIPVQVELFDPPHGFYNILHPHITLVSPTTNIPISKLGILHEYKISELIPTCNTIVHHVQHNSGTHVTRAVRKGKQPVIAGREVVPGSLYTNESGYSVLL
jgi:hypothetical protein